MSKLLRGLYRIFIKNSFIRWVWMLALALWGIKIVTDKGLALRHAPLSKTVVSIPPRTVSAFTIRENEDEDMTFTLSDSGWLVVKDNITLRLPHKARASIQTQRIKLFFMKIRYNPRSNLLIFRSQ